MTNVQDLIYNLNQLNQRVAKLEAGLTSHKKAIETFFSAIDELKEKIEHLESGEADSEAVVNVDG